MTSAPTNEKGFTLIELIITVAVLSLGVIGIYSALNPIIAATYNLSGKLTASYLAEEGMEITRNIRDNNVVAASRDPRVPWNLGLAGCSLGCQLDYKTGTEAESFDNQLKVYDDRNFLMQNADGLYGYNKGKFTPYRRKITVTQDDSEHIMKVVVDVFWDYNGKALHFQTGGYLYDYK